MATNTQQRLFTPSQTWRSRFSTRLTDISQFDVLSSVITLPINRVVCVEKITTSIAVVIDESEIVELSSQIKIVSKQKSVLKETLDFGANNVQNRDRWVVDLRQPTRKVVANAARPNSPPEVTYINEFDVTVYLKDEYQIEFSARVQDGSGNPDRDVTIVLEGYEFFQDRTTAKLLERLRS